MSALHDAIKEWNSAQIGWLIEHGGPIDEPDETGATPLMLAVSKNTEVEHIRKLLAR